MGVTDGWKRHDKVSKGCWKLVDVKWLMKMWKSKNRKAEIEYSFILIEELLHASYRIWKRNSSLQQLKPFPITCPTYKELTLCLCKVCLNACLILEPLVAQEGKESNNIANSMNAIFMEICTCDKSVNGYYKVVMCTAKK